MQNFEANIDIDMGNNSNLQAEERAQDSARQHASIDALLSSTFTTRLASYTKAHLKPSPATISCVKHDSTNLLVCAAGICISVIDTITYHQSSSVFSSLPNRQFWNPAIS